MDAMERGERAPLLPEVTVVDYLSPIDLTRQAN